MYDITLTGPASSTDAAREALVANGFAVRSTARNDNEAAVIVRGSDIDAAHAAVIPHGWRLAMHTAAVENATVVPATERALELANWSVN